jgi:hypothetical protein
VHLAGLAVALPLVDHGGYRLQRDGLLDPARADLPGSRTPKFARTEEELAELAAAAAEVVEAARL